MRYVSAYSFDAKWAGEFEIVMDQIRAPGYYRSNEKFSPKKWIFRWYYTEEGSIEIAGTDNRLGYNAKSKEYWIEPPENHESIKEEEATTSELEENKKNREQPFINNLLTSFNESIFDGDESVMVMTDNMKLRNNRLNLLSILRNQSLIIADFNKLS